MENMKIKIGGCEISFESTSPVQKSQPVSAIGRLADLEKAVESSYADCVKYMDALEVMSSEAGFGEQVGKIATTVKTKVIEFLKKVIEFCQYIGTKVVAGIVARKSSYATDIKALNDAIHNRAKEDLKNINSQDENLQQEAKNNMASIGKARTFLNDCIKFAMHLDKAMAAGYKPDSKLQMAMANTTKALQTSPVMLNEEDLGVAKSMLEVMKDHISAAKQKSAPAGTPQPPAPNA